MQHTIRFHRPGFRAKISDSRLFGYQGISMTTQAPPPHTVLIADDHPIFRAALRKLLETDAGLRVVGEAVAFPMDD